MLKNEEFVPAFPSENDADKQYMRLSQGMSLRDYFAAKAMQAACEKASLGDFYDGHSMTDAITVIAYSVADAMMEARK